VTNNSRGENGKLNNRILAAFLVTLFIVATFATVAEVQAHYTLGEQSPTGPVPDTYGSDETPWTSGIEGHHVEGILGYVKAGLYYAYPQDQLDNYYSPDGAIITDTSGGLTFYINFTDVEVDEETHPDGAALNIGREVDYSGNWLYICIPPEFGVPAGWVDHTAGEAYVTTSITNDYKTIQTGQFASDHDYAPSWWYVRISSYTLPDHEDKGYLYQPGMDPYPDRQIRTGWAKGLYSVSVSGLTAPSIAGKYMFKILYTDPAWADSPSMSYLSIPYQNYPTLVVKGELDPGYISGRVLYCGSYYFGEFYGKGVKKPGRVVAEGEAIDPVTNEPTGRPVKAWGYFSADAEGFYEIEGVAPGIYTLTAEAAGFPPVALGTQITVKRGQSLHGINIYVCPGAKIELKVNSKCPSGAVTWPEYAVNVTEWNLHPGDITDVFPIKKPKWALYDEEGTVVVPTFNAGQWITAVDEKSFTMVIGDPSSYIGTEILWDGHVPNAKAHWISGLDAGTYYPKIYVFGYVQTDDYPVVVPSAQYTGMIYREMDIFKGGKMTATVHFHDNELPSAEVAPNTSGDLILEARDADDNLVAWNWTHVDITALPDPFKGVTLDVIGDKNVPYGIPAGTYTFKVYYYGYAQQEFPGQTVQLCTANSFSFHLVKGANITVTVYSRDWQSPSQVLYWLHEPSKLKVYFYNSAGDSVGDVSGNQVAGTDHLTFAFWGKNNGIADYKYDGSVPTGLPTDVYSIEAYTVGYIQKAVPEVWAQKATSTGDIPLYLFAGAAFHITVNFKTEELFAPLPPGEWSYYFRINIKDEEGNLAGANITSVPQATATQPDGVTQWTFDVLGFNGFDTPGREDWTSGYADPYETGFIPSKAWGYIEPVTWTEHYDYGIDAGTYTIEVIDETNGYVQTATVAATVSLMGAATLYFDMHEQAHMSGTVWQRNFMGDFRRASWYTVEISGSPE